MNEVEKLAEEAYDHCCLERSKRMHGKKNEHSPRDVGCEFEKLFDNAKEFYRDLARWHLNKLK